MAVFSYSVLFVNYSKPVEANVFVKGYKLSHNFIDDLVTSYKYRKGIQPDINSFMKPDGTIDWDAYEAQNKMVGNIFYKSVQDATEGTKKELRRVLEGETDVITKTPMKDMPGWSKALISTAAFVTGADLIFDIYQWATDDIHSNPSSLEFIDGRLVTIAPNDSVTPIIAQPMENTIYDFTPLNVTTPSAKTFVTPNESMQFDFVHGFFNGSSTMTTKIFVSLAGVSDVTEIRSLDFVPSEIILIFNDNYSKANIVVANPAGDKVKTLFNNYSWYSSFTSVGPNQMYYTAYEYAMELQATGSFRIENTVLNPVKPAVITTIVKPEEVPKLVPTTITPPEIDKSKDRQVLIVPDGLTPEQIQQQLELTPDIMIDPEGFLERNPDKNPHDEVIPKEDTDTKDDTTTKQDMDQLGNNLPKELILALLDMLRSILNFMVRLFTFVITIPSIPEKPIPNEIVMWFFGVKILGIQVMDVARTLVMFGLGMSVYRIVRRVF